MAANPPTQATEASVPTPLTASEQAAASGHYELFKTSSHFDSTASHPQWLGPETQKVKDLSPA